MPRPTELIRLNVVAGILRDTKDRVLISERLGDGPFQGMWEFPGGKINADESAEAALGRELKEEIGIEPSQLEAFLTLSHAYPDRQVDIQFFLVKQWLKEPKGLEGQKLKWVAPGELHAQRLLPADVPVIEALVRLA